MTATFSSTTAYSLAEMRQFYEEDGKLSAMIEMLMADNPILMDIKWMQGNMVDGHKAKMRTELPTPIMRRLYQGTPYTKSGVATVKEPTRQISDRWGIDIDELRLYEGSAQGAFRVQEGKAHIEGMQQKCVDQLIYGNPEADVDELRGLSTHYKYKDGPNVVDAGATSGNTTSIWGVCWGPTDLFGFYPRNLPAGLQHEDLGVFDAEDANGNKYRAVGDEWKWNIGFFLADWRSVVRICNIDVDYLEVRDPTDATFIDFQALTIAAKNKIPVGRRGRMRWYCSSGVKTALELQASMPVGMGGTYGTGMVTLTKGQLFGSMEVDMLHGKPILECDAILETETAATATP